MFIGKIGRPFVYMLCVALVGACASTSNPDGKPDTSAGGTSTSSASSGESGKIIVVLKEELAKLTPEQRAELKARAEEEGGLIVSAYKMPPKAIQVCDMTWMAVWPFSIWACEFEYACDSVMSMEIIDMSGTRHTCTYDCTRREQSSDDSECDCELQSGENVSCPR